MKEKTEPIGKRSDWRAMLGKFSYKMVLDNVPYLAFLAVLCVIYINNSKNAVTTQRSLNKMNDTLKELRWEYMNAKSQMMSAQMEIEVMKNAADLGLKPMLVPAFRIAKEDNITTTSQAD